MEAALNSKWKLKQFEVGGSVLRPHQFWWLNVVVSQRTAKKFTKLQKPHVLCNRSDEGLTLETSAFCPLRWLIYVFNSVVNTKLPKIHISHQNVHFRWQNAQQSVYDGNRKTNKTNKVVEQAKRRVLWGNIEALVSCISKNVNCVIHFVKRTFNHARTFHHSLKSSWANESKDYYNVIHPFVRFLPSDIGNRLLQAAIVMSDWPSKDSSRFLIHMAPSGRVIMIY